MFTIVTMVIIFVSFMMTMTMITTIMTTMSFFIAMATFMMAAFISLLCFRMFVLLSNRFFL